MRWPVRALMYAISCALPDQPSQMKSSIKLIQTQGGAQRDGLLNALRYTTKHMNDVDTPKQIKQMLA